MAQKLNVNALLHQAGYGARKDFGAIAKWAAAQNYQNFEKLVIGVKAQFGEAMTVIPLRDEPVPFQKFLPDELPVDSGAMDQMKKAMRLPVAAGGALMPDCHQGYALPIGGVAALDGAISPGFVGFDIGCRMHLSAFNPAVLSPDVLDDRRSREGLMDHLINSTSFGLGSVAGTVDHPVMHDPLWAQIRTLKDLKAIAREQLGSQGAGNHFADLVVAEMLVDHPVLGKAGTRFVALMTHSGSRKAGNLLGRHYANLADAESRSAGYKVEKDYGFLLLDSEAGQEYFKVMTLMGSYAQANHQIVHARFTENAGLKTGILAEFENHHNFAWLENGLVVHRKGATPAGKGIPGIIPGSSGAASYLVEGLGNPDSFNSASHGAGRPHSRSQAKRLYDEAEFKKRMKSLGISYYGIAPDETFAAYKDIDIVMGAQQNLVRPIARMLPRVVVMGGNMQSDDGD